MAGEFSYTPLGELCDPARGITYGIVKVGDFVAGGVPVIRGGDIRNGRIVFDNEKRVTEEISQQFQRTILKGGEIVINLIAEPGHTAIVSPELAGANVSRDVGVIPLSDTVDHRYVDYCLKSPMAVHWLTSRLQGSVTQKVNLGTLRDLPIPTPGLDEQRAIAHVLGTLDDKIELSRRMSETLEVITRTLFKSWFVDFDPVRAKAEGRDPGLPQPLADLFPARLIDSDLGEIPEGWEVRRLGDLADIDKGLSYKGAGLAEDGGLPMVNLGCFAGGGIFKAENIKRYRGDYKDRHLVRSGDLVLANTDVTQQRVILGSPALVPELNGESRFLFTHHTFAFRFKPGAERWRRFAYFTLLQPQFREIAEGFATGTTVLALPRDGLAKYSVVLPPEPLLLEFERQVQPMLSAADVGLRQSRVIVTLRDTLLPKLISGELRVRNTETFVGSVT